jgi:elongation factor P hydroxylase
MSIRRVSSRTHRLDRSVLAEHLLDARSYLRIAGYFTSSLFEITHEWLAEKTRKGLRFPGYIGSLS